MSINSQASNIHIQTRFPFKIPQSQPKEGDLTYLQNNFPQKDLTLNASANEPRLRVLVPPWRMHRPDEPCPYYAPNGEFSDVRGKVETGYKLDYGRTNHEINIKANMDKNKWSRIRQMRPNEYVDITDPDMGIVQIRDDSDHEMAALIEDKNDTINDIREERIHGEGKGVKHELFSNRVERFNTPRPANRISGSLNDYTFYAPNTTTYNDYNKPVRPKRVQGIPDNSSSKYAAIDDLHKYTDNTTIRDTTADNTAWSNDSERERYCPVKDYIRVQREATESSWKRMEDDTTVNREAFRRIIHDRVDKEAFMDVNAKKNINRSTMNTSGEVSNRACHKRGSINSSVHERSLYGNTVDQRKKQSINENRNGKKEGFTCQCQPYLDSMYKHILEARASAILMYLLKDQSFSPWIKEWKFLERNINKCNMDFTQLADDHEDVAYSMDKGSELSFRFRDKDKYMPLSVESYILAHEMAHVANEEVGHGEKFQELMHLIEVAAYMLQFIDLSKYSDQTVHSNGQEILSRRSIKYELFDGIQRLIDHSDDPEQREYWEEIKKRVANNK